MDTSKDPVTPKVLSVLLLRTADDPWLPRLKSFWCEGATEAFITFIPLFLSSQTTQINVGFAKRTPTLVIGSIISQFPTLCPNLESVTLSDGLPRDPIITEAVSEMLLACNQDSLRLFHVKSPLTEEAREVVCQLPRLSGLWLVVEGPISLPTMTLPNLTTIQIKYDHDLNWLQGFLGATLKRLESVGFGSESSHIEDILGAFERVALTTSAPNTLSEFSFYTQRAWSPNYSSLLSFKHLNKLDINFSCDGGCSSRLDDDIVMSLARAMPKLEILQLGTEPCKTPTGVTVNGLIYLAYRCPHLSKLRIHFQVTSLLEAEDIATLSSPSDGEYVVRWGDCALTELEVGRIPIPAGSAPAITLILLQIFPRILDVNYTNSAWKTVAETIKRFRRIGAFVRRSGKLHQSCIPLPIVTPHQERRD